MSKSRIAVHVLYDIVLPFQTGNRGSDERKESTKRIAEILEKHGYDFEDLINCAGYYVTDAFREISASEIEFKDSDGKWRIVPKDWIISEVDFPSLFAMWDRWYVIKNEKES